MPETKEELVQTPWFWFQCPHCHAKLAVTFIDLENGLEEDKKCLRCKKSGWTKTQMIEATYSMGKKYGEKPK